MLKDALEYLVSLQPYREKIGQIEYADRPMFAVVPPRAKPLGFQRLQGFVDHLLMPDLVGTEGTFVHVVSPFEVQYLSKLDCDHRDRECYSLATYAIPGFKWGQFLVPDEFVIAAQCLMVDTPERARLLELVGNAAAERVVTSTDDGVSQTVAAKAGVSLKASKPINNPFVLQPHRTFAEVAQPASPFILRAKQAAENQMPLFALFSCDNEAWQLDAVENIRAWLDLKLQKADPAIPILA